MNESIINEHAPLLNKEIMSKASVLASSLLSDAQGLRGAMSSEIKPVTGGKRMIGTAITVDLEPGDNLYLHQAIYSASEGYVLVVDGKNHTKNAYMGELMALAAQALGINGIVIDGLVRDKEILKNLTMPIYSRGFIPNGPRKESKDKINTPIKCGGVDVKPGDLIVGDEDGVTVVSRDKLDVVFQKADQKKNYEIERIKTIEEYAKLKEKGVDPGDIKPRWLSEKIEVNEEE